MAWRFEVDGREKLLTLSRYPQVSLGKARRFRDKAAAQRRSGVDPALAKRLSGSRGFATARTASRRLRGLGTRSRSRCG